jgi:large subunit ribosomal protein L5
MEPELRKDYRERIVGELMNEFGYGNVHQAPRLEKIVVNCSVGSSDERGPALEDAVREMSLITGQRPVITKAKKSISNFKLREKMEIGAKVTLRGRIMWDFLQRLTKAAIPRIRDFRGVAPRSFDGRGNYTLGIQDQTIFPEIELDKVKHTIGFDITIVTSARTDEEGRSLLKKLGMPFRESARAA